MQRRQEKVAFALWRGAWEVNDGGTELFHVCAWAQEGKIHSFITEINSPHVSFELASPWRSTRWKGPRLLC